MTERVLNVKYDRSKKYFDIIKFLRHKHVLEDVDVIGSISDTIATRVDQPKAKLYVAKLRRDSNIQGIS